MMIPPRITSACLATGGIKRPWRDRDFHFELAPILPGGGQLDTDRMVRIDNYGEAAELVLGGMGLRMADAQGGRNKWVLPSALRISNEPWDRLDELWSQTLPPPPVTRDAVNRELAVFLGRYADLYEMIAGPKAAVTYITSHNRKSAVDLSEFNLTRLVEAAYDSAFRTGSDIPIHADQVLDCERVLCLMQAVAPRSNDGTPAGQLPALRQTLLCAVLRWRLANHDVSRLDLEATVPANLAMLAKMSYQGARNALASSGISTLRGRLDSVAISTWLQHRLGFAPLRECERPEAIATQTAIAAFRDMPLTKAFTMLRKTQLATPPPRDLSEIEQALSRGDRQNGADQAGLWRCYARHLRLCPDSLILGLAKRDSVQALRSTIGESR